MSELKDTGHGGNLKAVNRAEIHDLVITSVML